ncbi:hypothetical protein [Pedobacter sp. SYSU D00535]|uniref:hypothetical protein n=1 Tax=Pedobacter sp. SYSU D00535 TaxID=2810308 RepID=UPI001A957DDE|nr:hypothetical protein [Pedobacter sp. SYSU D00535]
MAGDKKISQIAKQLPLLSDVVVAARDNNGNPINITFTLADILAAVTGSPFKIFPDSDSYEFVSPNAVITDSRLAGKTGYPIYSTQVNSEFRSEDLTYDAVNGRVTIKDFELQEGQHISIYPTVALNESTGNFQAINNKIAALEEDIEGLQSALQSANEEIDQLQIVAAPFSISNGPSAGWVLWGKPANQIPAGWEPVPEMEGRMAIGAIAGHSQFDFGKTGGSTSYQLMLQNLPPIDLALKQANSDSGSGAYDEGNWGGSNRIIKLGGTSAPFSLMNPYRTVHFIRRKAS